MFAQSSSDRLLKSKPLGDMLLGPVSVSPVPVSPVLVSSVYSGVESDDPPDEPELEPEGMVPA